jgi:predicted TIM-barrel fold metal-dependent hydrolase
VTATVTTIDPAPSIAGSPADPVAVRPTWGGPVIDADVHAVVPSIGALAPYLADQWTEFIEERGVGDPFGLAVAYPPAVPTTVRPDWRPADGRPPAGDVELLRRHVLDPLHVDCAILTCNYAVDSVRHPDFAAALAAAVNDWIAAEWLDRDPRLRASITLPGRHPEQMVAEIRRVARDRRFVQVLMPARSDRPYGNRIWHPVLAEIAAQGLVMGLHWGGTSDGPPSPTGWPSWFVEEYAAEQQVYMAQLTSLIGEGAFQAVPDLKVAVGEVGFAWLPSLVWRLDKEWKGLRRDIPWVTRPPSEIIREHVRLTVAPLDMAASPDAAGEMAEIIGWLGSEDLLMFATDYPHAHEVPVGALLERLPETMRPRLMAETARALYGLGGGR